MSPGRLVLNATKKASTLSSTSKLPLSISPAPSFAFRQKRAIMGDNLVERWESEDEPKPEIPNATPKNEDQKVHVRSKTEEAQSVSTNVSSDRSNRQPNNPTDMTQVRLADPHVATWDTETMSWKAVDDESVAKYYWLGLTGRR